jgi:hypothetical protein
VSIRSLPLDGIGRRKEKAMTARSRMKVGVALVGIALAWGVQGLGHKPLPFGEEHSDASRALVIHEVDVSQVLYCEITTTSPQYWLAIDVPQSASLLLSIGVPVIDRYRGFRPALAVLGPDLPPTNLPFPIPDGYGAEVLATDGIANPSVFHEPFTGTDSWTLRDDRLVLGDAGRYYLVLFSPRGDRGKMWAAIGEREAFGLPDFLNLPAVVGEVRAFHEVPGRPAWLDTAGWILFGVMCVAFWLLFAT